MNTSNPIFSLKNFRSFGSDGADFELAPITVLTGCNSAGKSSLVKALMLLSNQPKEGTVSSSSYDIDRCVPSTELNINSKTLMLGRYDKILHDQSKERELYFSYRIWSDCLQEEVIVKRQFISTHEDVLNNGSLRNFIIEKTDGSLIYEFDGLNQDEVNENFSVIEDNYNRFVFVIDYYRAKDNSLKIKKLPKRKYSQEEKENLTNTAIQWLNNASEKLNILNIKVDNYNRETLKKWIHQYYEDLNKTQLERFVVESLSEKEKEERKKNSFMSLLVNEVICPWFINDVDYINSSSAIINRLYSSEDENKMSRSLRSWNKRIQYFGQDNLLYPDPYVEQNEPGTFLNRWINKFQIGDSVKIEGTQEGLGLLVYIVKNGKKRLLADEGYGITQLISLLLQIDNNIKMFCALESDSFKEDDIVYVYPRKVICVEEPEVHLHPKYQSLLAEMFVEAYQKYNIHFIIETHSEYLIRKLQVMVADKECSLTSNDVSLNYVEKDENGVSTNRKIEILKDGRLSEPFGTGFYDEATGLSLYLLEMKMNSI